MSVDFLDDLEAGELSVEFEGQEPWDLLEWALERFGGGLAFSTAFQEGDVALIDMAYRVDPAVRVFSIDTGRLPQETLRPRSSSSASATTACGSNCSRPTPAGAAARRPARARTCSIARSRTGSCAATSARSSR